MSKRAQGSTSKEGFGSGETETDEFGVKNLLSAKKTPPQDSSASNSPGNQELDQSLCFIERHETGAKQQPRPNSILSRAATR